MASALRYPKRFLVQRQFLGPILVAVALAFSPSFLRAEDSFGPIAEQVQKLYEQTKSAVVRIEAEDEMGKLAGTGFFIDPNGTIYTSYSVGGDSHNITVEYGSNRYPAQTLIADPRGHVAILKVHASTPWLRLGKSDQLKTAAPVVTIGYPPGLPATPDLGLVGGFDSKDANGYFSTTLIRANVVAQHGESGAPLLNLQGEVVGIIIGSMEDRTACYALPIKAAEKIRSDYLRFGELKPGWLGITVNNTEKAMHNSTVVVSGFTEGSPAEAAGIQAGDTLLQIGTSRIQTLPDMINASFFLTAKEEVPVTVLRDDKEVILKVPIAENPAYAHGKLPALTPSSPVDLHLLAPSPATNSN